MSLRALSKVTRTFGFRMMLWYSTIFAFSSICVFFFAFWYLSSSLRQRDHALTESKLREYASLFQKGGVESVQSAVQSEGRNFFVRIADSQNHTLFQNMPPDLFDDEDQTLEFNPEDLQKDTRNRTWTLIRSTEDEEDILEIRSAILPNGGFLEVGITNENRQDALEQFLNLFLVALAA